MYRKKILRIVQGFSPIPSRLTTNIVRQVSRCYATKESTQLKPLANYK